MIINRPSCTECIRAMVRAKEELLIRIACANCQQAERELAGIHDTKLSSSGENQRRPKW